MSNSVFNQRKVAIFNEWARQYAENPDSFNRILDEHGKPVENYGEACARHFDRIAEELEEAGKISRVQIIAFNSIN
jgi:hypothetical protein